MHKMFEEVKSIASTCFKVKMNRIPYECERVYFGYGIPDGDNQYKEIRLKEDKLV